ncbi:hypothetical protein [Helicobacter pylori]|nr:hypothetical protein [Helicobacter pylori]MCQ2940224.1 hypothetical protein [Helicobacter pylori]
MRQKTKDYKLKIKNHQALLHACYYGVSVGNTAISLTTRDSLVVWLIAA